MSLIWRRLTVFVLFFSLVVPGSARVARASEQRQPSESNLLLTQPMAATAAVGALYDRRPGPSKWLIVAGVAGAVLLVSMVVGGIVSAATYLAGSRDSDFDAIPANPDFGSVEVGTSVELTVTMKSRNTQRITLNTISVSGDQFTLIDPPDLPASVLPDDVIELKLRFTPRSTRPSFGVVEVRTDRDRRTRVVLRGEGRSKK